MCYDDDFSRRRVSRGEWLLWTLLIVVVIVPLALIACFGWMRK